MTAHTVTFQYGNHQVQLETGRIARQATAAVMVTMGQTMVLCTVVGARSASPDRDFFPLTVDYQERTYAAGKIPGGFFKREGRPTEKETLTSRLIDRPIRPLFPEGFKNEVQIICTVMSLDPRVDPDIPALIGASAALSLSGMPFQGPLGAARVGYKDGQYLLNPSFSELDDSELDLVVAGTASSVLMVESEARQLSEEVMLGAVMFGHSQAQAVINAIQDLVAKAKPEAWAWQPPADHTELDAALRTRFGTAFAEAYLVIDKMQRRDRLSVLRKEAMEALAGGDTRHGQQARWAPPSVTSNTTPCAATFWTANPVLMAVAKRTFAPSRWMRACCHARTVQRCSSGAKRRRWW